MTVLLDCPTCGGLLPTGRRCCPHCHCSSPAWKRWAIAASAAATLGAAGCDDSALHPGSQDAAVAQDASSDLSQPEPAVEYGPAMIVDFSEPADGGK